MDLFGWSEGHLSGFHTAREMLVPKDQMYDDDFDSYIAEDNYSIQDILFYKGKKVSFEYDFGDSWIHEITLSSIKEYEEGEKKEVVFVSGKGACPPEDCGGIWGYGDLLELLEKQKKGEKLDKESQETLEWYGIEEDFDPEYLDKTNCEDICKMFSR